MAKKSVKLGPYSYTEGELNKMFAEARRRGREKEGTEITARRAYYDAAVDMLVIELKSGAVLSIPRHLIQGLRGKDPVLVADVELGPRGASLHWEKLDNDFSVGGLVAGVFGSRAWMAELGRAGGKSKSPAKRAASRANGRLGGRPRGARAAEHKSR